MEVKELRPKDAIKTYRYLRIGIIGAVVLLGVSIAIEHDAVSRSARACWQTSISAYYYTPARAIFVGALMAVGLSLIVIKGRNTLEDACLNFAGILAPVVAVVPTTDVGKCWSVPPNPLPVNEDGSLANWVVTNIDNNFRALLIALAVGFVVTVVIALLDHYGVGGTKESLGVAKIGFLVVSGAVLLFGWWLMTWGGFETGTHGPAAIVMFVFLIGAVVGKALQQRKTMRSVFLWLYSLLALVMPIGGAWIGLSRVFEDHTVFALEAFEIVLFAVFWVIQTVENWNETPPTSSAVRGGVGNGE